MRFYGDVAQPERIQIESATSTAPNDRRFVNQNSRRVYTNVVLGKVRGDRVGIFAFFGFGD